MQIFYFHENNRKYPWMPSYDIAKIDTDSNFFALADGIARSITHQELTYPKELYGGMAAERFISETYNNSDGLQTENDIKECLHLGNKALYKMNTEIGFNYDEIKNKYWLGECTGVITRISNNKLIYGLLEDCYINVLRGNLKIDLIKINYQIMKSYKYAQTQAQTTGKDLEKIWCTELRNNPEAKDSSGERVGWGVFNGETASSEFWQVGSVELQAGDIVRIFTDGMIPVLDNKEFQLRVEDFLTNKASSKGTKSQIDFTDLITEIGEKTNSNISGEKSLVQIII